MVSPDPMVGLCVLKNETKSQVELYLMNLRALTWRLWTIKDYNKADMYDTDETALFFKASLNKSLIARGDDVLGTKISKDRVTKFCQFALGQSEKMKPTFIWKSKNPRAIKGAHTQNLPVF